MDSTPPPNPRSNPNAAGERTRRFGDYLPTGDSRKAFGVFFGAAGKGGTPDDVCERVLAWTRADWAKAKADNDVGELARLERLGVVLREHRDAAVNLATWALRAKTETQA